jgi:hypothetical protein
MKGFKGSVCLAVGLLLAAGAASAQPQTNQQQKCINKVNKAATKVQAAQVKANSGCVKAYVKGDTNVPVAEACVIDDPKDKVEGKQQNVLNDESKNCLPGETPDFGYTDGLYAGSVAYNHTLELIHDVFGSPLDAGLFKCDPFEPECLCQRQAIDRVGKLVRAMGKIWLKCKKPALAGKDPFVLPIDTTAELAECITNASISLSVEADSKGKIADGTAQLGATLGQFCVGPFTGLNDPFGGGECAGQTGNALRDCLAELAKCRFCKMASDVDNLAINCATWSGAASCP